MWAWDSGLGSGGCGGRRGFDLEGHLWIWVHELANQCLKPVKGEARGVVSLIQSQLPHAMGPLPLEILIAASHQLSSQLVCGLQPPNLRGPGLVCYQPLPGFLCRNFLLSCAEVCLWVTLIDWDSCIEKGVLHDQPQLEAPAVCCGLYDPHSVFFRDLHLRILGWG